VVLEVSKSNLVKIDKTICNNIQGVFEVEAFLLTCDSMRYSKEF
jgi:hypothetical protein